MTLRQKALALAAIAASLALTGCQKKAAAVTRIPPAPPPPITQPEPEVAEAESDTGEPAEATAEAQPPATAPPTTPLPRPARRAPARQAPAPAQPEPSASRAATEDAAGGESTATISARMSPEQAANTRQNTVHLQEATESNLRRLKRELNEQEKAMVQQIRTHIAESRAATAAGDLVRAQTLALKAHLLSQELLK